MSTLHRVTYEALSLLKSVREDQLEDRMAYRNEVRRLVSQNISLPFSDYEHFLDRYGYLSIDHRSDSFTLTTVGLEAVMSDPVRLKSLNDDVHYHFQKEIEVGQVNESMPMLTSGRRFDQHYIRFEGIGRGGIGSVWRGEHLKTGRPVVIKTLEGIDEVLTSGRKSTLKKRLERVIRSIAKVNHPFISPILDLSVHHTPPYYVMPLCSGGSLRDLLQMGSISPEIGFKLFAQICLGLTHAHEQGVLHLDLKPENILLDQRGNIKLFDFGLSRTVARQVSQVGRQSYIGFGSVAYMPPELLRDPLSESPTIDIYALGLILYEILVGELPGRRSPMPSEVIKGLPAPIDDLFDRTTQDLASRRPQSMNDVLTLLNQIEPFDRLSKQSTVMIFNRSTISLPGIQIINIPEPESLDDLSEIDPISQKSSSLKLSSYSSKNRTSSSSSPEKTSLSSTSTQSNSSHQRETSSQEILSDQEEDYDHPSQEHTSSSSSQLSHQQSPLENQRQDQDLNEFMLKTSHSDDHEDDVFSSSHQPLSSQKSAHLSTEHSYDERLQNKDIQQSEKRDNEFEVAHTTNPKSSSSVLPAHSTPPSSSFNLHSTPPSSSTTGHSNKPPHLPTSTPHKHSTSTRFNPDLLEEVVELEEIEEVEELELLEESDVFTSNSLLSVESLQEIAHSKKSPQKQSQQSSVYTQSKPKAVVSSNREADDFSETEKTTLQTSPKMVEFSSLTSSPPTPIPSSGAVNLFDEREPSVVSANSLHRADQQIKRIQERIKRRHTPK